MTRRHAHRDTARHVRQRRLDHRGALVVGQRELLGVVRHDADAVDLCVDQEVHDASLARVIELLIVVERRRGDGHDPGEDRHRLLHPSDLSDDAHLRGRLDERHKHQLGLAGRTRGKKRRTTVPDEGAAAHPDRVERRFVASAPNRLWIADITYVATWSGFVYSARPAARRPQSTGRQRTSMPLGAAWHTFCAALWRAIRYRRGFASVVLPRS